jgi:hypothetical protein
VYSAIRTLNSKTQVRQNPLLGFRDLAYGALLILVVGSFIADIPVKAAIDKANSVLSYQDPVTPQTIIEYQSFIPESDRVSKLRQFLESKNSPLAPHAQLIVSESDKYALDWTKIVAISGMESSFGVLMPTNSYNAWGLGGTNFIYFSSWEEGIKYEAKTLGSNYKLNENQGIKDKYCPAPGCNQSWAKIVTDTTNTILEGKN